MTVTFRLREPALGVLRLKSPQDGWPHECNVPIRIQEAHLPAEPKPLYRVLVLDFRLEMNHCWARDSGPFSVAEDTLSYLKNYTMVDYV